MQIVVTPGASMNHCAAMARADKRILATYTYQMFSVGFANQELAMASTSQACENK
jgi:hypothetical protein